MAQKLATVNHKLKLENEVLAKGNEKYRTHIKVQDHTIRLQKDLNHKVRKSNSKSEKSDLTTFAYGDIEFKTTRINQVVTKEGKYRVLVGNTFSLVASEDTKQSLDIKFKKRQLNKSPLQYKPIRLKVNGFGRFLTRVTVCKHLPTVEGKARLVSAGRFRFANLPILDAAVCCFCANTTTITSGL